jgi:hypothetical protein
MKLRPQPHHGLNGRKPKWTRAAFEPVMADVRSKAMSQKEVALKHGIPCRQISELIQKYHHGELK